jgi:hypothetical protein
MVLDPRLAAFGRLLAGAPASCGDVPAFAAWVEEHRLLGFAWLAARKVDPGLAEALGPARVRVTAREMAAEGFRARLLDTLLDAGARPIVFKGLGVAHLVYPSPELRPLGDVDLLFEPGDAARAADALERAGFVTHPDPVVREYFWQHGYNVPLAHPLHGLVEVHHAIYPDCPDAFLAEAFERLSPARVLGREVRALADVDLFITLAVHYVSSVPGSHWVWLLDLWLLARRFDVQAWCELERTAARHGLSCFAAAAVASFEPAFGVRVAPADDVDHPANRLVAGLHRLEAVALARFVSRLERGSTSGDVLRVAHRLDGHPGRRRRGGALAAIWSHPGAVCYELGVPFDPRAFWRLRLRHVARRVTRALGAVIR